MKDTELQEFTPYKIKPSEYSVVVQKYEKGEGVRDIAKEYGVNNLTIYRILKKCKANLRKRGRKNSIPKNKHAEIIRKYSEENKTATEIAKEFNTTPHTIGKILRDNDIEMRKRGPRRGISYEGYDKKRKVPLEDYDRVAGRYRKGESSGQLARSYGVSREIICKILEKCGVDRRRNRVSKKAQEDIVRMYKEEEMPVKLIAAETGRSPSFISLILSRNNIEKDKGRTNRKIPVEDYPKIVERYKNGDKLKNIGETYGVRDATIGYLLKKLGVAKDRITRREDEEENAISS